MEWVTAVWDQQNPVCSDSEMFMQQLKRVFDHPTNMLEAAKRLLNLHQGQQSVSDFAIDFTNVFYLSLSMGV